MATKTTPGMRRVLIGIRDNASWRAGDRTVRSILEAGLAKFIGLEDCGPGDTPRWVLLPAGVEVLAACPRTALRAR